MNSIDLRLRKIVSGGQTGVDRGSLDAAIDAGIEHGGWCPLGRRAEDGVIPHSYRLQPTESADYKIRTERNVVDSDGTLIICRGALTGGTLLTRNMAEVNNRPVMIVDLLAAADAPEKAVDQARHWLGDHGICVLNVAGPRESQQPGIAAEAREFLLCVMGSASDSCGLRLPSGEGT